MRYFYACDDVKQKLYNHETLNENELRYLKNEVGTEVEETYGENRRWSRSVNTVIEIDGRYFRIYWEQGLTEYQEDEFYHQPEEVVPKTYEKTITVTEWVPVNS